MRASRTDTLTGAKLINEREHGAGCRRLDRRLAIALCVLTIFYLAATTLGASGARLYKSGPIQISADGAHVWVANRDNDSVSRLTTATNAVLEVLLPALPGQAKHQPLGIAVSDDGSQVWVSCHDSDRVYVLNGGDGSVQHQIDLPWGTGPYSVALSPPVLGVQQTALVTGYRAGTITVIDATTRAIVSTESVYKTPMGIGFLKDPDIAAWVTHLVADGEHNRMTRVDLATPSAPRVTTQLRVTPVQPQDSASTSPRPAEGGYVSPRGHPAAVPMDADAGRLWIPTQYQNIHNTGPSPEAVVQAVVRKINTTTRQLVAGGNLPGNPEHPAKIILSAQSVHDTGGSGYEGAGWDAGVSGAVDVGFSSDGATAYLLFEQSEDVLFVPTNTTPIKPPAAAALVEVEVGKRPTGIVLSPVDDNAFVYNSLSRTVSVVDLATPAEFQVALTPVSASPFSSQFQRGAEIFHTSNEGAVSGNNKVSCASCHVNAEADGRGWDLQHLPGSHGPRDTPSLLSVGRTYNGGGTDPATGWGQLHRSGDRDEVQDFEHTIQGVQMGGSGFLGGSVNPELGTANAGLNSDLDALATYVL